MSEPTKELGDKAIETRALEEKASKREPAFFEDPTIDNLVDVTLALGAELWVQRERMRIVETLLAEHGKVTPEMIEAYQDPPERQAQMKAKRDAFVDRLFGAYGRPSQPASHSRD